jgi:hypothetical protein
MSGAALFSSGNPIHGEREDRANCWVIIAFMLIGLHGAPTQLKSLDPVTRAIETPVETDRLLPVLSGQSVSPRVVPAGKRPDPVCVISSVSHQHQLPQRISPINGRTSAIGATPENICSPRVLLIVTDTVEKVAG